jgi:hypothetical protein
MDQATFQLSARNGVRASLACVQCRSRHLRCDGLKPTCSRCRDDASICTYMKSRRGGRRRAPAPSTVAGPEPVPVQGTETPPQPEFPTPITNGTIGSQSSLASSQSSSPRSHFKPWEEEGQQLSERLIHLYYRFFHVSHPCALPLKFIGTYRASRAPGIDILITVMRYIGSLYTSKVSSELWREAVEAAMRNLLPHSSLFEVQALLLYAVTAQWTNYTEYSDALINLAIDRGLALGLFHGSFATRNAATQSVYAESCRRTWWQLYLAELSMAAVDRKPQTRLNVRSLPCSVDLPCSEHEYECGVSDFLGQWPTLCSLTYSSRLFQNLELSPIGRIGSLQRKSILAFRVSLITSDFIALSTFAFTDRQETTKRQSSGSAHALMPESYPSVASAPRLKEV